MPDFEEDEYDDLDKPGTVLVFTGTCQECGHKQKATEPKGDPTDSYRNAKCRKCKSSALDFGSNVRLPG